MWRATIRGLLARKVRLLLTALAVVLGVAFVSGTYVLTDTLKASFGSVFSEFASGSDLVVQALPVTGNSGSRQRIPEYVLDDVRDVQGVGGADGFVIGTAQFVAKDGSAISTGDAPSFGISWSGADKVGAVGTTAGRAPVRDGEVAMDGGTAKRNGFKVGDSVRVLLTGEAEEFKIVGILELGNRADFGAVSFAAFDPETAQRVLGAPGLWDAIYVRVAPGVSSATVERGIADAVGPGYEVSSSAAFAAERRGPVDEALNVLNQALLGFAAVGLLVGAFIIFNTFTILVSQRTRELGLLRALGASGAQVIGSVLAEAAVVGVIASALGLAVGIGLASLLLWMLPGIGYPVPGGDLVVLARTVLAAMTVGIGVAMAAAVVPALRAARTAPIAAIGDLQTSAGTRPIVVRAVTGGFVMLIGLALSGVGIAGSLDPKFAVALTFIGGFIVFIGVVAIGPLFASPISSVIGWPLHWVAGVSGRLARHNAMRNARRTTATAAALVVGLALVALVAIFADSLRASVRNAMGEVSADYIVAADDFVGFSPEVATRIERIDGVETVVALQFGDVLVDGREEMVTGTNSTNIDEVVDLRFVDGSARGIARQGILVSQQEAERYGRKVGDLLVVNLPGLGPTGLEIGGIFTTRRFTGYFPVDFILPADIVAAGFGTAQQDTILYVNAEPGQTAVVGRSLRSQLARPFPNVAVQTPSEYLAAREQTIGQFLNVFFALLLLSEVIALLGIINTLLLSVYERTRELGLLRTIGTTRRQIWAMVCGEALIIAVIGCLVGIGIGMLWGWGVVTALSGQFIDEFSVPVPQFALFLVASVVAGFLAALIPAFHASRLNVLDAIAME